MQRPRWSDLRPGYAVNPLDLLPGSSESDHIHVVIGYPANPLAMRAAAFILRSGKRSTLKSCSRFSRRVASKSRQLF
jgi:hypothetical protein